MQALDELSSVASTLENDYVTEWRDQGRKIVGYVCSYLPEEILHAAAILPYRITGRGCGDTSLADAYLTRVNCTFARCCLENGLSGRYDFLDGAVFMNGCDHIRRAYDNWQAHGKSRPYMYMFPVPHLMDAEAMKWYREEILRYRESLETYFGCKVTGKRLSEAVAVYNESRRLLHRLYELRAGDNPPVTGLDVQTILSAASAMPKEHFNRILTDILKEAETAKGCGDGKVRLLVAGSMMDEPDFVANIEDLGAIVVADTLCIGARSFWDLTDESKEPLEALTERYLKHVPCPRMMGQYARRLEFLKEQARRSKVDGVVLEQIKFCDLHGTDNTLLKKDLEKEGMPVLELERQYGPLADAGRVRTRVQAFLERIRR